MPDVVILHARDKDVAAARLEESVAAAGYAVDRVADGGLPPERIAAASALIVLWSKGAMASAEVQEAASRARGAGKLIEATADGIMPVPALDQPGAALISGWRGEPFHPGWQRIAAELKQVCGARRAKAPASAAPSAAVAAASAAPRPGTGSKKMLPLALALLLFAGLGAAAWFGASSSPEPATVASPAAPTVPAQDAPVEYASAEELQPAREDDAVALAPAPPPAAAAQATPRPAPAARPAARAAPARTRPRPSPPAANMRAYCAAAGRSADQCRDYRREAGRADSAGGDRPVRYRNARNMRRFCAAAGRNTPQCRTFRRNTRD